MMRLWDVKLSQTQTIGSEWASQFSVSGGAYRFTFKADKMRFPNGKDFSKVVFWANFLGPDTLVSKDTECVLTNTPVGRALIQKWTSEPFLFRQLSSNQYDMYTELVYANQIRSFMSLDPRLTCKANVIGYEALKNGKVIFMPNKAGVNKNLIYSSRDLVCTTDLPTINRWKRNPWWVEISLSH